MLDKRLAVATQPQAQPKHDKQGGRPEQRSTGLHTNSNLERGTCFYVTCIHSLLVVDIVRHLVKGPLGMDLLQQYLQQCMICPKTLSLFTKYLLLGNETTPGMPPKRRQNTQQVTRQTHESTHTPYGCPPFFMATGCRCIRGGTEARLDVQMCRPNAPKPGSYSYCSCTA